ncbi:MAG: leucyl-tRNA synthase [Chlamydiae bacterium SM23_39]|nr:MAG: leucyl-tRNA synthase [Chlamydiae bacterium SM23_39]
MEKYDHVKIEKKWQKYWEENKSFKATIDLSKPKFYILDMFPYPSGAGLHVGHVTGYTGTDIIARYKRCEGFNVLHPMGWDSFGLPAEQYAIKTKTHPAVTTKKNIDTYRRQLKALGFSYDWGREIATSDSSYYKWTQWIFTKLYKKNLAYEAEVNVNFCPELGTVLANEEVENGKTKEGGYPVERKPLKQWILKITEYADRLISDLDLVDWPENLKKLQINWIGKSKGAKIVFVEKDTKEEIEVFTTRPDTLFGATYFILAPEHPLISKITKKEYKKKVEEYKEKTSFKSDLERTELAKEKTGVFTGAYVINPVNNEKIPVWISDYVLMSYGKGAVMAVPAHDERDFEFAFKYDLPVKCVVEPDIDDIEEEKGISKEEIKKQILTGSRCWIKNGRVFDSENDSLSLNGLKVEDAKAKITFWLEENKKGEMAVSYKLRDWLFSRQRYWGEPFPILHFEDGTKRVLDLDELPLRPPVLEDYKSPGDGRSPIERAEEWVNIIDKKTSKKAKRETQTMPQWAGSCWYYLRFCDPLNEKEAWSKEKENYWMPVDLYVGGSEHAVLHLLYARFWHKVLYDLGLVHTKEPFFTYRYQGVVTAPSYKLKNGEYVSPEEVVKKEDQYFNKEGKILISQIEKMSKSKSNGVTPDDMIEEFGADSLRLYEMFMGPFDKEKIWNTDAVFGCKRFLNRFYNLLFSDKITEKDNEEALKLGHKLLDGVSKDIEAMQFNTAISKMMEFINSFSKLDSYPKSVLKIAIQMLYPFAPHIAEEMWQQIGEKNSLTYHPWPKLEKKYLEDEMVYYVIQINGKVRENLYLSKDRTKEDIFDIAKQQPKIKKYLLNNVIKLVFVPNKLLNIVMEKK